MSVIRQWPDERWTCSRCTQAFPDTEWRYSTESRVYFCGRCMVDELADNLRGAVDLLRELSEKWSDVRVSGNAARVTALGDAVRRAREFTDAAGGQ